MSAKHRIALVGCGNISVAWLKPTVTRPDVEFVALVDINQAAAEKRQADYQLSNALVTTDLRQALKKTSPDIVFNCTIPEAHAPTTIQALKAGCHVLCEKPLADTMANARKMLRAAEQARKTFAVIQNRRYNPQIRRLRAFIDSGAIGPVTTVQSNFFIGAHFGGFRDRMEHVLILDMAIHTFDAARYVTGADPLAVMCHEWNPPGSWYDHHASAIAIFEMTGDIVYSYEGSWCAEGLNTPWESHWRIIGRQGSVTWDGVDGMKAQVVTKTGGFRSELADRDVPTAAPDAKSGSHAGNIAEFLNCISLGGTPETCGVDNVKSLAMVHGAIESSRKRRRIELAP